jgi:hypothetical protein
MFAYCSKDTIRKCLVLLLSVLSRYPRSPHKRKEPTSLTATSATPSPRLTQTKVSEDVESESDDAREPTSIEGTAYYPQRLENSDDESSGTEEEQQHISMLDSLKRDWSFQPLEEGATIEPPLPPYKGKVGLRVDPKSFQTPRECLATCGGLDHEFIRRVTKNSNYYMMQVVVPFLDKHKRIHGLKWSNITVGEMSVFLGILLRISMEPRDLGGYRAYFSAENRVVQLGSNKSIEILNTKGWAQHYMNFQRFLQIRQAFHPEQKHAGVGGDKCYQIRFALNHLNKVSRETFHAGPSLTFDEGGIPTRSRFCPVRMYNKDKPDKFRIDFFILACAIDYPILHADVYQGKCDTNVGVSDEIGELPTMQKAVVHAIVETGIANDPDGAREVSADNRYGACELARLCELRLDISLNSTTRTNRKGWPKEQMDLVKKKGNRGQFKMAWDPVNRVQVGQWVDNRVVSIVSTNRSTKIGTVQRRIGAVRENLPCPQILISYQKTMFGVDKGDQYRAAGIGFASKSHFKKWYKKALMGVLDFMLLNGFMAWRMSIKYCARKVPGRPKLERYEFYAACAQELLNTVDETVPTDTDNEEATSLTNKRRPQLGDHTPTFCDEIGKNKKCLICNLDLEMAKRQMKSDLREKRTSTDLAISCSSGKFVSSGLSECWNSKCGIVAHSSVLHGKYERPIHKFENFKNLTCFEIAHSSPCKGLFNMNSKRTGVKTSHPIYKQIRVSHGLPPSIKRKKICRGAGTQSAGTEKSDDDESDDDELIMQSVTI